MNTHLTDGDLGYIAVRGGSGLARWSTLDLGTFDVVEPATISAHDLVHLVHDRDLLESATTDVPLQIALWAA